MNWMGFAQFSRPSLRPRQQAIHAAVDVLLRACDVGDADAMQNAAQIDPCLQEEADSLRFVNDALRGGTIYALIIEPMQSEGDRYGVARFYKPPDV